jgi:regulatory protein
VKQQRSLKARALQWLAQREQSRVELRRKLMPHAVAEAAAMSVAASESGTEAEQGAQTPAARVEAVLDWLETHKYLSNERFAESRVHARSARFGNLRIRQELKQHQVSLPPEASQALASTELERGREVCARKFSERPANALERAKQARFLAARGFSPEVISRILRPSTHRDDAFDASDLPE